MIEEKLGSSGVFVKNQLRGLVEQLLVPIISFFKRNGFKIALGILRICISF